MRTEFAAITALCLLLFPLCSIAAAEYESLLKSEYGYRRYTTQDGLPTNMVENVFQDSRGYMWFATEHGVSRYDGRQFKTYMANKSLPINKIEETEQGDIVIYGYYFINILNPETGELRQTFRDRNLNYLVYCSHGLPRGYSMISKRDVGKMAIFHLEADTLREVFYHPLFDRMYEGQSVFYDLENSLVYIPTQDDRLYIVDFNGNIQREYDNIEVSRFLKNGSELWAVGLKGVWTVSLQNVSQRFRFPLKLESLEDIDAILDSDNNLIVRDDRRVMRYRNGRFETLIDGVNMARNFMFDSEGNFWFVSRAGIFNFFHLDVKIYKINDNGDLVNQILPVDNHSGYLATANGSLIHYKEDSFTKVNYPGQMGNSFSQSALKFDDILYFTTYHDILKLKDGHFSWLGLAPDIYHITANRLGADKWIVGGWNKLWILDREGERISEMSQQKLNRNTFYTVAADKNNNIWIGGHSGICLISPKDTLYFFSDTTMNAESVDMDKNGTLWFACEGNIYSAEGDTISKFLSFDDEVLYNIRATDDGLLVVSSSRDVRIIDIATKHVVIYNYSNGLSDCEPSWATMTKDFAGNIWLGTQSPNILRFNPRTLFDRKFKPRLQIEQIECSANNVDWRRISDFEKLDYRNKNIKIKFAGLCFSNPDAVRYRYRLLGFQDEWSASTADMEVVFNNLPNGYYEFQLTADCGDNNRTQTLSLHFSLAPAFWQTTWFIVVSILSLISLTYMISLIIIQRKNRALLEKLRAEKELNELKISGIRLKAIPHFNANVLSAIEYYIANRTKEEAMHILGIYSDFTYRTLMDVDKAARSLAEELAYVRMYLNLEKIRFLDKFDFLVKVDDNVDRDMQLPNMMLHTYCENAVKHGLMPLKSGGLLMIRVSRNRPETLTVSVEDNGVGRDCAGRNIHTHSTKQGLSILNRQIEIYNSFNRNKINRRVEDLLKDGMPCGTRFTVEIPLDFTYIN